MEWLVRMKDALDLMESRMEESVSIEEIAKVACSSPFHFQRMFNMLTGVTVAEYIRRRKLTLAAQELAISSVKVLDVALKYGYESPESFSKAFRKAHGISPSAAREPGVSLKAYPRISFHLSLKGDKDMDYRIVNKPAFMVTGKTLEVTTKEGENQRQIPQFWQESNTNGTSDRISSIDRCKDLIGLCLDIEHGKEEFTYMIAVENVSGVTPEEFESRMIPEATWAVFTSVGPMPGAIQDVWRRIYSEWFPATGYEHAVGPEMEVYPPGNVMADDYKCEVWVPIVKK